MHFRKWICGIICGVFACTTATAVPVSAEDTESIPVVEVDASDIMMQGYVVSGEAPEGLLKGEISITVYDRPIDITIQWESAETLTTFYEMCLEPLEGSVATEYVFPLVCCELPLDPSEFEQIYTADFLTGVYSSAYSLTISVPGCKEEEIYTENEILIAYYHTEDEITDITRYQYTVTFDESKDAALVSAEKSLAETVDGSAILNRNITFRWHPYTLGDVNDDGGIDPTDAYLILKYYAESALGLASLDGLNEYALDVNDDGEVTPTDAYFVLVYYAKAALGVNVTLEEIAAAG